MSGWLKVQITPCLVLSYTAWIQTIHWAVNRQNMGYSQAKLPRTHTNTHLSTLVQA